MAAGSAQPSWSPSMSKLNSCQHRFANVCYNSQHVRITSILAHPILNGRQHASACSYGDANMCKHICVWACLQQGYELQPIFSRNIKDGRIHASVCVNTLWHAERDVTRHAYGHGLHMPVRRSILCASLRLRPSLHLFATIY